MAAVLEGLGVPVLETILSKVAFSDAAAAACVSTTLRSVASDDALWRHFCARDLAVCDHPLDPDGNPCHSFKEAYRRWFESFGMYPFPLVRRAKECWSSIKSWMAVNLPEVNDTLRKGASEAEIKSAEKILGVQLPIPTKVLYRLCDGQQTLTPDLVENRLLAPLGVIGGYEFYDYIVNVHLLPLRLVVTETKRIARQLGFLTRSKSIVVAASYYMEKFFFLNCTSGQLYVGTRNLREDGEMMPCVPQSLIRPAVDIGHDMPQDALLLWLEEHCRRLQSGMIKTRELKDCRSICIFPETPPYCSVAVTNGVQVRSSAIFVPEASEGNGGDYYYSYSIRISLLPEGCLLDGTYYSSCQLCSRHWIIRSRDIIVSDVGGEAVIGKFPLLIPGKEEFVYQSCTPLPGAPGSIEGSFTFVPGRISKPEGRHFDAKVAPFILEEPEYIF
ncbi:F-box protein SKIP16-like [Musa acuminata AAA Group]|uniref:F-box protein SKIP16-like n=1 Tax=Musa acuminata AAA Group TaxID=214697 RepID=UPI0031D2F709